MVAVATLELNHPTWTNDDERTKPTHVPFRSLAISSKIQLPMLQGVGVRVGVRVIRNEFGRENTETGIHAELSTKTPPRWVYRRDYRVFVNSEQ